MSENHDRQPHREEDCRAVRTANCHEDHQQINNANPTPMHRRRRRLLSRVLRHTQSARSRIHVSTRRVAFRLHRGCHCIIRSY